MKVFAKTSLVMLSLYLVRNSAFQHECYSCRCQEIIPPFQHITWLVRYPSLNFFYLLDTKTTNQSMRKILMNQSISPCLISPHGLFHLFLSWYTLLPKCFTLTTYPHNIAKNCPQKNFKTVWEINLHLKHSWRHKYHIKPCMVGETSKLKVFKLPQGPINYTKAY